MLCELVQIQTRDQVVLDGAIFEPTGGDRPTVFDSAIVLHGLGGNFYSSRLLNRLGKKLVDLGLRTAQVNLRGHDTITLGSRRGRTQYLGAASEVVDECRWDIEAWIQFLLRRGGQRIVLVGHSLGAIKSLYAQAHLPDDSVAAVVAMSASRLNHETLMHSAGSSRFQHWIQSARHHCDSGDASHLLRVDYPFPTWITAEAYLEKYGPENRYDWNSYLGKIQCPLLMTFGSRELAENDAFVGVVDLIDHWIRRGVPVETRAIEGADHFYTGQNAALLDAVASWLIGQAAHDSA